MLFLIIRGLQGKLPSQIKVDQAITRARGIFWEELRKSLSVELRHPVWDNANTSMLS